MNMYLPKTDIYNNLKELNYFVAQVQPPQFNKLPAIIFKIGDNNITTDFDNKVISQEIEVVIDVWANDSVTASKVLAEVEEKMRKQFWTMTYSADVPNTGNLQHIVTRFRKII